MAMGRLGRLTSSWIADSGATAHMCSQEHYFTELRKSETPTDFVQAAGEQVLPVLGVGRVCLSAKMSNTNYMINLKDVLYTPRLKGNLIFIGVATDSGIEVVFGPSICEFVIKQTEEKLARGTRIGKGLYLMDVITKRSEFSLLIESKRTLSEWHRALGHVNPKRIESLSKDKEIELTLRGGDKDVCPVCPAGSGTHASHPTAWTNKAKEVGDRVFIDLSGPIKPMALNGSNYFLLAKDEYSTYTYIFGLQSKADVCQVLSKLITLFETESGKRIRRIHTDRGSEFLNNRTDFLLTKENISHENSAGYTPQQNGCIERQMRTITNMARTMLLDSGLPKSLWQEATEVAVHINNRLPNSRIDQTPYEVFTGRKPVVKHVWEFGKEAHVIVNGHYLTKFEPRTEPGYVVGFTRRINTYKVFLPGSSRVIESADVIIKPHKLSTAGRDHCDRGCAQARIPMSSNSEDQGDAEETSSDGGHYTTTIEYASSEDDDRDTIKPQEDVTDEYQEEFLAEPSAPPTEDQAETSSSMGVGPPLIQGVRADTIAVLPNMLPPAPPVPQRALLTLPEIPITFEEALNGSNCNEWKGAIAAELEALEENHTWSISDRPATGATLTTKWVFTVKRDEAGAIEKYKARLVARGFQQQAGVNFFDTYAPVVKLESVRLLLAIAAARAWVITQFDISTAFLNGVLEEEVFIEAPKGVNLARTKCLRLHKALYGLKQAPRAWHSRFSEELEKLRLKRAQVEPCIYYNGDTILAIYVDDGLIISKTRESAERIIAHLKQSFKVKILSGSQYLGMEIRQNANRISISQRRYIKDILDRFNMESANPPGCPFNDPHGMVHAVGTVTGAPYRQAIGALQYLANATRPDILFASNFMARFNAAPKGVHWTAVKQILAYLGGTPEVEIKYSRQDNGPLQIDAYSDADYNNETKTRQSISGGVIMVAGGPVLFFSRKQPVVSLSSTEAEYIAACEVSKELKWLTQLLDELNIKVEQPTLWMDNRSAIRQIEIDEIRRGSKHVDVRFHYVRECLRNGLFALKHVPGISQPADILTKALSPKKTQQAMEDMYARRRAAKRTTTLPRTRTDSAALLVITLVTCLIYPAVGYPFTPADKTLWFPSELKIESGIDQYLFEIKHLSPCGAVKTLANSNHNTTRSVYEELKSRCEASFKERIIPAIHELGHCLPDVTHGYRVKRMIEPMTMSVVTLGIFIASTIVTAAVEYFDASSVYNSVPILKQNVTDLSNLVEGLKAEVQSIKSLRGTMLDRLESANERIEANRRALADLAKLSSSAAWSAAELSGDINERRNDLLMLADACTYRRQLSVASLNDIMGVKELKGVSDEDTYIHEVRRINDTTILMEVTASKQARDTFIFQVVPISHHVNLTDNPQLMKYAGPSYVIFNKTSNCVKGFEKQGPTRYYEECSAENYRDPSLDHWVKAADGDVPAVTIYKTRTESIIYCMYEQIFIEGKLRNCPAFVFRVPITTPFRLRNFEHQVSYKFSQMTEQNRVIQSPVFENLRDEAYERELSLLKTLRQRHQESLKPQSGVYQNGHLVIPQSKLLEWLTISAALVTITSFMARCYLTARPQLTLQPEHHSEAQTVNINIDEGRAHEDERPIYNQPANRDYYPARLLPIYANPRQDNTSRGGVGN